MNAVTRAPDGEPGHAARMVAELRAGYRDLFPGLGPLEAHKQRISGRRRWYAGALVGLSFLVIAMVQGAIGAGSVGVVIVFEVLAACFGAVYLFAPVVVAGGGAFTSAAGGGVGKAGALALMLALTVPMIAIGGPSVAALWIYIGVVAAILFPLRWALPVALALAVAMMVLWGVAGAGLPWELALTLVALTLWMAGFVGNIRLTVELRSTREELATAAVAAERARIGRDLHDILGHSLTAIAVKAGLARRLIARDPGAASVEVSDVERLAREALSDVRATAAGFRDVSLAGELAVARSVLQAAGIRAEMPTAVDDVSPAGREVFGYVIREAVTNVVRHSGSGRCVIELTRDAVQITDDGRGAPDRHRPAAPGPVGPIGGPAAPGGGLRGLAERLSAAGGVLRAGSLAGGGFRVRAEFGGSVRRFATDAPAAGIGRGADVPVIDVGTAVTGATGAERETAVPGVTGLKTGTAEPGRPTTTTRAGAAPPAGGWIG